MKPKKTKIDPIATKVTILYIEAMQHRPPLPITAYALYMAKKAIGWELAKDSKMARREVMKAMEKF